MRIAAQQGRRKRGGDGTAAAAAATPEAPALDLPVPEPGAPQPAALLAWYDRARRTLPWRAAPGTLADPYRVWLSEIMLQQTTVRTVGPYFEAFLTRWPDVSALAAAPLDEVLRAWAGLGYYARARNLHACAREVAGRPGGCFPDTEEGLRRLPGIGPYTAAAIAAIAFGRPATAVDGNVERVVARLFAVDEPLPAARPRLRALAATLTPADRPGDFAQAMMDLGATVCTPRSPACGACPFARTCRAAAAGLAAALPRRAPKQAAELRQGAAFWLMRADGCVALRRRPPHGLLGGMTEVPTSDFAAGLDAAAALAAAPEFGGRKLAWHRLPGSVRHVFTHFPLELAVYAATVEAAAEPPPGCRFVPLARLSAEALPTLMRKVVAHAIAATGPANDGTP